MNNNIKRAKQYIDCFNKENPNITYTCFGPTGPTGPTARCNKSSIYFLNGKVPYYFNIP